MIEIALKNINGKDVPAVTSLQVAESFEKEHKNVLRDIEAILPQVPEKFVKLNFELYEYPIETGIGTRTAKAYLLSKDAFTLLTMGYTGEKAMAFKVAYIARFNEMEKALQANAPTSLPEALRAYANMLEENELIRRQRDEAIRTKAQIGIRREALTGLPISGILNFPNRTGVTVALAWPHQAVKSGLFCSCHRYTSSGCGHILARRRPGVREAPAAVRAGERRLAFFCAQNPKSY